MYNKYKEMNALMKKAGRALNLKPHWVIPIDPVWRYSTGVTRVQICGPGDIGESSCREHERSFSL